MAALVMASLVAGCGSSSHGAAGVRVPHVARGGAAKGPGTVQIAMFHRKFRPSSVAASRGQVVVWTNRDAIPHTVTALSGAAFSSRRLQPGGTYTYRVYAAGVIHYGDTLHPRMVGTIAVTR